MLIYFLQNEININENKNKKTEGEDQHIEAEDRSEEVVQAEDRSEKQFKQKTDQKQFGQNTKSQKRELKRYGLQKLENEQNSNVNKHKQYNIRIVLMRFR